MKYSQLFGKTLKESPRDATLISHKLLYQAGFIRESTAGRYYFLPLGWRVHEKIKKIIKEEMDATGAQEMIAPVLHPLSLWQETNRTSSVGFELMSIKDSRGFAFALGGTAEEMFVELVRRFRLSYRDLPFNLYQFSTKFRDEKRARGGLLRVREFVMKDAYSFHRDEKDFKREYEIMAKTYERIFKRLGMQTHRVEADNGYIGGEYCHEFQVESKVGEGSFFVCDHCDYRVNTDIAQSLFPTIKQDTAQKPMEKVLGKHIIGVEELAEFLKIPVSTTTKTLLYQADKKVVAVCVRGGYNINETKLKKILGCYTLELASEETVRKTTGAAVGYAGPVGLPKEIEVLWDKTTEGRVNFEAGANKTDYHNINVNFDRDVKRPEQYVDVREIIEGEVCVQCKKGKLSKKEGIEVGNIFQLGYHYTHLMKGSTFIDEDGSEKPYYMGCYGIGIGRSVAAVVEVHHDDRGIVWPDSVAPFTVHLISLPGGEEQAKKVYEELLKADVEVLWDDREESAGVKFADCDLIGIPWRMVVSKKTAGNVEMKRRSEKESVVLDLSEALKKIKP